MEVFSPIPFPRCHNATTSALLFVTCVSSMLTPPTEHDFPQTSFLGARDSDVFDAEQGGGEWDGRGAFSYYYLPFFFASILVLFVAGFTARWALRCAGLRDAEDSYSCFFVSFPPRLADSYLHSCPLKFTSFLRRARTLDAYCSLCISLSSFPSLSSVSTSSLSPSLFPALFPISIATLGAQ
ncbi:hypothetical protein B0H13DRAFT_917872 [Mycena leptocephala]|nr:hypothetical protein B0H13DRAFT_917872 [Mycena leptocephala]